MPISRFRCSIVVCDAFLVSSLAIQCLKADASEPQCTRGNCFASAETQLAIHASAHFARAEGILCHVPVAGPSKIKTGNFTPTLHYLLHQQLCSSSADGQKMRDDFNPSSRSAAIAGVLPAARANNKKET
jgi:hypothetical protein